MVRLESMTMNIMTLSMKQPPEIKYLMLINVEDDVLDDDEVITFLPKL